MARSTARAPSPRRRPNAPGRRRPRAAAASRSARRLPTLAEPPHAHIVCPQCGRIKEILLAPAERSGLLKLAARPPEGWSVSRLALSLTGSCPRCRTASPTA